MEDNNQFYKNAKTIEEGLRILKEWLATQPHLISKLDDQFLLRFLRCSDFSLQQTKRRLDNYYVARTMIPEIFNDRDPFAAEVQLILDAGAILPLQKSVGTGGVRLVSIRWGAFDPTTMPYLTIAKVFYMIMDILLQEDDNTAISGIHGISDLNDLSIGYASQFTPTATYKASLGLHSIYPIKSISFDTVNTPNFFSSIYTLIKYFFPPKAREGLRMHTDIGPDFYKVIPQSVLPKEYGGSTGTIAELARKWKKKVEDYSEWFKEDQKYYCNEELRPETCKNEIFGMNSTLRLLDID